MSLVHAITRLTRKTLDLVLIVLILLVLATIVIARVIPWMTGGATFVVGGGSMEPAIPLGAVVMAVPTPTEQLTVGDVVSVQVGQDKAVFTHRITRLVDVDGELWIETKGDANERKDPSIIPATSVIGRVDVTIPYAGYAVRLLSTAQGVMFLLALGVLVLAGAWFLETVEIDQEVAKARKALAGVQPEARSGASAAR